MAFDVMMEFWVIDLLVKRGNEQFTTLKVPPLLSCVVFHKVVEGVGKVELDCQHDCIGVPFQWVFLVGAGSGWHVLCRVFEE